MTSNRITHDSEKINENLKRFLKSQQTEIE